MKAVRTVFVANLRGLLGLGNSVSSEHQYKGPFSQKVLKVYRKLTGVSVAKSERYLIIYSFYEFLNKLFFVIDKV